MKKIYMLNMALCLAAAANGQTPEAGTFYHLITGYQGNYSNVEQRPNSCVGIRTVGEKTFLGAAEVSQEAADQLWQFVAKEVEGTTVYAIVNKANQYIPMLATIDSQNGFIYQDSKFAAVTFEGEIPEEAFGFDVTVSGTIVEDQLSETDAQNKYNSVTTGMQVGDSYVLIRPLKYRNDFTNEESVVDNNAENLPVQSKANQKNPPYYLNMGGNGRSFFINLWQLETPAPKTSQYFILVPESREIVVPTPEVTVSTDATISEDNTINLQEGSVSITLTASEGAELWYKLTETAAEEAPESRKGEENGGFELAENGTVTLTIEKNSTLEYYSELNDVQSEITVLTFIGAKVEEEKPEQPEQPENPDKPNEPETGISSVSSANGVNTVYDLQGRKVSKAAKGLYIINGKKVVL